MSPQERSNISDQRNLGLNFAEELPIISLIQPLKPHPESLHAGELSLTAATNRDA
jgi:hypothetical protein